MTDPTDDEMRAPDSQGKRGAVDFIRGWNEALDLAELQLRRHFQNLWPHDKHAADILQSLRRRALDDAGEE